LGKKVIIAYIKGGKGGGILTANVVLYVIDHFEKVTDKDAAVYTRRLAREEGIFVGNSAGSAIKGLLQMSGELTEKDVVVVLFHDHGSRYVGKMFNDDWMRERGFLDEKHTTAGDLIQEHSDKSLVAVYAEELVSHAVAKMRKFSISQIPVMKDDMFVGSLNDSHTYQFLVENPDMINSPISSIMQKPFPIVKENTSIEEVSKLINKDTPAVLVELAKGGYHIVTRQDVINSFA
jgi:cystathionine beta-synthase